jgi:hypothetical protein
MLLRSAALPQWICPTGIDPNPRALGHRRDTPSTGAWLPGAHAVERAVVPGDTGRGNPGGIIDGAMIRGPARPGCALM